MAHLLKIEAWDSFQNFHYKKFIEKGSEIITDSRYRKLHKLLLNCNGDSDMAPNEVSFWFF